MSTNDIAAKCRELRELQALIDEAQAEADAIKDALKAAIAKALALAEYDASSCEERVNCIVPREGNTLEVVLNDGRTGTVTWEERSRAESWTPEMKERARHAAQRKRTCVK